MIGPSWQGRRLIFGIRRPSGRSTWYRYDPATHRYASAKGPHNLASVAATRRFLYWQTAASRALRTGGSRPPGCALDLDAPRFQASPASR